MNKHNVLKSALSGLLLAAVAGCYDYPRPPAATLGDTYSMRERDKAEDLFKGMKSLTLADAQRIAILNNPTYIAAYHAVNAARMRYYQAWGAYSPTLSAGFSLQNGDSWVRSNAVNGARDGHQLRTGTFATSTTVTANLLVFDGLARTFKMLAAKHNWNYQKRMEEDACRTMMYSVAYAYNTVLLAIENRRIAEEDRKFQLSSLKDTQYKFQAGAVPLSDVLNFQIQMNNADVNMISADYQYETAIYALAVLMGYPDGTLPADLDFPSDFKTNFGDLPSVEIYLDTALANRPDLKAYREQLEVARYQMYQTYSAYSPTVNAFAEFSYGTSARNFAGYGYNYSNAYSETPSFTYGAYADWTIFNGLIRYNQMREYQASLAVADYNVADSWFTVVGEVRTAYANYIQSVRKTKLYEKTRDLSAQQRDLVDDEYRAGNTELTRLNEAQRDLVDAETSLAASYINIQNAKAQLDSAVGVNGAEYYLNRGNDDSTSIPGLGSLPPTLEAVSSRQTNPVNAPDSAEIPGTPADPGVNAPVSTTQSVVPVQVQEAQPLPDAPAAEPAVKKPVTVSVPAAETAVPAAEPKAEKSAAPAIPATPTAPPQSATLTVQAK